MSLEGASVMLVGVGAERKCCEFYDVVSVKFRRAAFRGTFEHKQECFLEFLAYVMAAHSACVRNYGLPEEARVGVEVAPHTFAKKAHSLKQTRIVGAVSGQAVRPAPLV